MAGLNILINKAEKLPDASGNESLFETSLLLISQSTPYPHYPIDAWETDDFFFAAEGYFFEWKNPRLRLESFAKNYFKKNGKKEVLIETFSELDAEFVLFIYDKSNGKAIVINDVLGRYPLYFCETANHFIISRNIDFLGNFKTLELDTKAGVEALTFGFTLGRNTLYRGIEKLEGGSLLEIRNSTIGKGFYHQFNYEELINPAFDVESKIEKVRSLFVEAIKNRSRFCDFNIVTMSGGLDSRTVAAGFKAADISCKFISYSDSGGTADRDLRVAKKIAEHYDQQLEILKIPPPEEDDFRNLFQFKSGLSYLDMTFFAVFLQRLSQRSKRPAIFTGDGGDKIFPNLQPILKKRTFSGIRDFTINQNKRMSPGIAAAILKQPSNYIEGRIKEIYESYPEKDWNLKHVHFIMQNRVGNWLVEGEDRNRSILSSFTPFYMVKLVKILMSAPEPLKKGYFLYNRFLMALDSGVAAIPNANWDMDVSEAKKIHRLYLKEDIKYTRWGARAKRLLKPKRYNHLKNLSDAERELFRKFKFHSSVKSKFEWDVLEKLNYFDEDSFHHLLTLMMAAAQDNKY